VKVVAVYHKQVHFIYIFVVREAVGSQVHFSM